MPRPSIAPSPEELARFGHIAAVLRAYCRHFDMSVADFQQYVLRERRTATAVYPWLAARAAPSEARRLVICAGTGITPLHLCERDPDDPRPVPQPDPAAFRLPIGWAGRPRLFKPALQLPAPAEAPAELLSPPAPPEPDPLEFQAHADGTATIRVHKRLPIEHATKLFRVLLDSGVA